MSLSPGVLRVSVRALVAFSVFPPDILPVSALMMERGRRGHVARQGEGAGAAETALAWEGEEAGLSLRVTGRMDLYDPGASPPLVEEIKLCPPEVPGRPLPEHQLQAACYGFMLSRRDGLSSVLLRVSYVTPEGRVRAAFDEVWARKRLETAFFDLLRPFAAWQARLRERVVARDEALSSLPFPYPAYRPGQREMAEQAYLAIARRRRLFAVMPTGTGKSAAVLYPALKALGQGKNRQVFCLTARGTQRAAVAREAARMREAGLPLHSLVLAAKESLCPMEQVRCHPDHCPRAKGHYLRQPAALEEALDAGDWDTAFILTVSERHALCPFEFSLALCEIADLVVCDYNYAFDPQVRLSRVFDRPRGVTLLVDEAHNLPDRAREMLSGEINLPRLLAFRRAAGKALGRGGVYRACTALRDAVCGAAGPLFDETLAGAASGLLAALAETHAPGAAEIVRGLISFLSAFNRLKENPEDYVLLRDAGKTAGFVRALCLNPAPHLREATRRLAGCVYYSATLLPLPAMREMLGGETEDACLNLPSPFPPEHLLALQLPLNTRYDAREASLAPAADALRALFSSHPGKYIAYLPSFAYLHSLLPLLEQARPALPLLVQRPRMDETERESFLSAFTADDAPVLGLCVLGGVFAEGVDLPGTALIGAAVLGVGLPQVNPERELYRARMQDAFGDGFAYACQIPGMHRVLQAAGRLIRSETDRGVLLLMDDRYAARRVSGLMPAHLRPRRVYSGEEISSLARAFWEGRKEEAKANG